MNSLLCGLKIPTKFIFIKKLSPFNFILLAPLLPPPLLCSGAPRVLENNQTQNLCEI